MPERKPVLFVIHYCFQKVDHATSHLTALFRRLINPITTSRIFLSIIKKKVCKIKFIYSEKATNFYEISTIDLSFVVKFGCYEKATKIWNNVPLDLKSSGRSFQNLWPFKKTWTLTIKSTVEISQNFVAFSEYMNFIKTIFKFSRNSCPLMCNLNGSKLKWYEVVTW